MDSDLTSSLNNSTAQDLSPVNSRSTSGSVGSNNVKESTESLPSPNPSASVVSELPIQSPEQKLTQTSQQQPQQPAVSSDKKWGIFSRKIILALAIVFILILVVGGTSFFVVSMVNKPAKIREQLETIKPVFDDYTKSISKIGNHLKEDNSKGDSASIKRDSQKGSDFLESAENDQKTLNNLVQEIKDRDLRDYKKNLNDYIAESNNVIDLEKETVKLMTAYVDPVKKYEELTLNASGGSNYLYSDPDKYIKVLSEAIESEGSIIKTLEAIEVSGDLKEYNDVFIASLKTEQELFKQMKSAVENRSTDEIAAAQKQYAEHSQKNVKKNNLVKDKLDSKVNDFLDKLDSKKKTVNQEYNRLKGKFNI